MASEAGVASVLPDSTLGSWWSGGKDRAAATEGWIPLWVARSAILYIPANTERDSALTFHP